MKKPNFFIIGAPKCGTTSMAAWLSEHPQIFMSDPKEPYFFSTDIDVPWGVKSLEKYLQIFQNAGDKHLAVGEASVMYLFSHVAINNIIKFNPAARFIVMLRNPIDMAPSWHAQSLVGAPRQVYDDFEADWKARRTGRIEPGKLNHKDWDPILLQHDKVCKLGEQVQRLLQTVDAKSVLFIVMDDLISDPLHEYQRVLEFLDVPYDGKNQFSTHNPAQRPRSKLIWNMVFLLCGIKRQLGFRRSIGLYSKIKNLIIKKQKASPLQPEFRQELIRFFKKDVKLLSSLLKRDFSHWLR